MRPVPVPDSAARAHPDEQRVVVAAPDGDLTNDSIRPVDTLTGLLDVGDAGYLRGFRVYLRPDDDDLARIAAGGHIEVTFITPQLVPFAVDVVDP